MNSGHTRVSHYTCFMLPATLLNAKFDQGLDYASYLASATVEQREAWRKVYDRTALTADQRSLLGAFAREMKVVCVSGAWCGDCSAQGPMLARIAEANPKMIRLVWLDRDEHKDLSQQVMICGGLRVPTVIFMAEDGEFCGILGDRTLARYRAIAARKLGAACPLPWAEAASAGGDEAGATLQGWVDEFERIQLMLRLSPRLREKHGD